MKIIIIGGKAVGKTSIFNRLISRDLPIEYVQSSSLTEAKISIPTSSTTNINISLWDASSKIIEDSHEMLYNLLLNVDGFIFVVDVTNRDSFKEADQWNELISTYFPSTIPKIMAVNKADCISKGGTSSSSYMSIEWIEEFTHVSNISSSWYYTVGSPKLKDLDIDRGSWHKQNCPESILIAVVKMVLRHRGGTSLIPMLNNINITSGVRNVIQHEIED